MAIDGYRWFNCLTILKFSIIMSYGSYRMGAGVPGEFFSDFPGNFFQDTGSIWQNAQGQKQQPCGKGSRPYLFNYFGFFFCVLGFFLDSVLRGVLFACSMAPTGVFLGFHSFSRVLNVFWVFSLLFTGFFGFERFCFVLAVFGRVSRDLHTCDH